MATFARLLPAVLCMLVLGAHFLRGGQCLAFLICLLFPLLWIVREGWVRLLTQALLAVAAIVWLSTLYQLASVRMAMGEPWKRMAVILGGVAAFNVVALLLLTGPRMRAFFRVGLDPDELDSEEADAPDAPDSATP